MAMVVASAEGESEIGIDDAPMVDVPLDAGESKKGESDKKNTSTTTNVPVAKAAAPGKKGKGKEEKKEPPPPRVSFSQLYTYATPCELVLVFFGAIFALATGAAMPVMLIGFGDSIDAMMGKAGAGNDDMMTSSVLWMVYIGAAQIVTAYIQNACFGVTGENQVNRMRDKFFKSILRQEIGWYDTSNPLQASGREREGGGMGG